MLNVLLIKFCGMKSSHSNTRSKRTPFCPQKLMGFVYVCDALNSKYLWFLFMKSFSTLFDRSSMARFAYFFQFLFSCNNLLNKN